MSRTVEYERRLTDSIMVVSGEGDSPLDERILSQGKIQGMLLLEKRYVDNCKQYMYNISGTQSLDQYCKIHEIGVDFLEKIIVSTSAQVEILSRNLVNIDCLLLSPGTVFVSNRNEEILYVACPGEEEPLTDQFRKLMEYLLTKINHKDPEAVEVAYSLYEKTLDQGYSLEDLRDSVAESHARKAKAKLEEEQKALEEAEQEENNAVTTEDATMEKSKEKSKTEEFSSGKSKLSAIFQSIKEELFWSEDAFLREVKTKVKKSAGITLTGKPVKKKEAKEKEAKGKKSKEKKAPKKSLTEELLTPVKSVEVPEIHPTICLSDARIHPEGLLLYEGYEDYRDYKLLDKTKIGSAKDADLVLAKGTISRMHAMIEKVEEDYYIEDLNSTNGTCVNDSLLPYKEKRKLSSNDILTFADVKFRFI